MTQQKLWNLLGLLLLCAAAVLLWAIVATVRSTPAEAHQASWDLEANCGSYVLRLDITDTFDGTDHRIIVTRDDYVVKTQDIAGGGDLLGFIVEGGSLPEEARWKAYIFDHDEVLGDFVYDPDPGDFFWPAIAEGELGLVQRTDKVVRLENTCPTATPTATATSTPAPTSTPEPTATTTLTLTRCEGSAQVVEVNGVITSVTNPHPACVTPTATSTPAPPASSTGNLITPPSTGDGGLR